MKIADAMFPELNELKIDVSDNGRMLLLEAMGAETIALDLDGVQKLVESAVRFVRKHPDFRAPVELEG